MNITARINSSHLHIGLCALSMLLIVFTANATASETPESVQFDSADGKSRLTGYLYRPDTAKWPGARPGIVLLHGRSGLFSSAAKQLDASTLSSRTALWGRFWAERGYVAIYVDSFSPRGHARGFAAGTNKPGQRPPEVNELTVRPHDAYQGLAFLRSRNNVRKDHIFLQGWSNGGSAALAAMAMKTFPKAGTDSGFRAAIAVYPGCGGIRRELNEPYRSYAPLLLLIGTADEEVSFRQCESLAEEKGVAQVEFVRYEGATHSYDTPTQNRTSVAANATATQDTMKRADQFFARLSVAQDAKNAVGKAESAK